MTQNNYFHVSYEKELEDTKMLIDKIRLSKWIEPNRVTIVNCFPEYSSRVTQMINHRLSYLNNHELFEVIDLQMPYPNMAQVWDPCDRQYQGFHNYLSDWVRKNVFSTSKYLFISAAENLSQVRSSLKIKLDLDDYRLASLYVDELALEPDFWVEKYKNRMTPLFQWENMDNPNRRKL